MIADTHGAVFAAVSHGKKGGEKIRRRRVTKPTLGRPKTKEMSVQNPALEDRVTLTFEDLHAAYTGHYATQELATGRDVIREEFLRRHPGANLGDGGGPANALPPLSNAAMTPTRAALPSLEERLEAELEAKMKERAALRKPASLRSPAQAPATATPTETAKATATATATASATAPVAASSSILSKLASNPAASIAASYPVKSPSPTKKTSPPATTATAGGGRGGGSGGPVTLSQTMSISDIAVHARATTSGPVSPEESRSRPDSQKNKAIKASSSSVTLPGAIETPEKKEEAAVGQQQDDDDDDLVIV